MHVKVGDVQRVGWMMMIVYILGFHCYTIPLRSAPRSSDVCAYLQFHGRQTRRHLIPVPLGLSPPPVLLRVSKFKSERCHQISIVADKTNREEDLGFFTRRPRIGCHQPSAIHSLAAAESIQWRSYTAQYRSYPGSPTPTCRCDGQRPSFARH